MPVCLADAFSPIKDNDYLDSVAAYFIPSFETLRSWESIES